LKLNIVDGTFMTERISHLLASRAITLCAKNEYRNITGICSHGLPCTCPLMIKNGVIVMAFFAEVGAPAQSLRDARLKMSDYNDLYNESLIGTRRTFQRCYFVRADPSERTIVIRRRRAIWTGAARVVECDCEMASVILRRGIATITTFFREKGIETVPMMRAFQFVVARRLESGLHATLEGLRKEREEMSVEEFVGRFAPHTLADVTDPDAARGLVRVAGQRLFEEEEDETERQNDLRIGLECGSDDDTSEEEDVSPVETLDRKMFTRDEWKSKVKEIKVANRERRKAHKPRLEKRKENRRFHHNAK
jgi:serine/threonine-protein kinase RIO1